jgi:hypothetical protein
MKSAHGITCNDTALCAPFNKVMFQSTLSSKPVYSEPVLRKYENAVVDYVVEGGVTLRVASGVRFKKFVVSLTNGYEPSSTRTILWRIIELYRILEPLLAAFLCSLDIAIVATLAFGLQPRQGGCEVAGLEVDSRVTSHAPGSANTPESVRE